MEVQICVGSSCHIRGSAFIINVMQEKIKELHLEDKIVLKAQFCMGDCVNGVCMTVEGEKIKHVSPANINEVFEKQIMEHVK